MKKEVSLGNITYFQLFLGKRVLKKDIFKPQGDIPIYSANVFKPFGYTNKSNIYDFSYNCLLWGIDGNFEFNVVKKAKQFATTDHAGTLRILDDQIIPEYLQYKLQLKKGFDRTLRSSLTNMKTISVSIPIKENGEFDVDKQNEIAKKYLTIQNIKELITQKLEELNKVIVDIEGQEDLDL